jgi:hypothetical protein
MERILGKSISQKKKKEKQKKLFSYSLPSHTQKPNPFSLYLAASHHTKKGDPQPLFYCKSSPLTPKLYSNDDPFFID